MSEQVGAGFVLPAAGRVIRRACRRLPEAVREERVREWTGELPAILDDSDVRFAWMRVLRVVSYTTGVSWAAHHERTYRESTWEFTIGFLSSQITFSSNNPSRIGYWACSALRTVIYAGGMLERRLRRVARQTFEAKPNVLSAAMVRIIDTVFAGHIYLQYSSREFER